MKYFLYYWSKHEQSNRAFEGTFIPDIWRKSFEGRISAGDVVYCIARDTSGPYTIATRVSVKGEPEIDEKGQERLANADRSITVKLRGREIPAGYWNHEIMGYRDSEESISKFEIGADGHPPEPGLQAIRRITSNSARELDAIIESDRA